MVANLKHNWHSKLPLVAKVVVWKVFIGGLPLGLALKRRGLATCDCFFCIVQVEDNGNILLIISYMSDCLSDVGLNFSNLANFVKCYAI